MKTSIGFFVCCLASVVFHNPTFGQATLKYNFQKKGQNTLSLAVSNDGTQFATGGDDNKIAIFSLADGKEISGFSGSESWITAIRFKDDGKLLAAGERNGKVTVYDVTTGTIAGNFLGHKGTVYSVDFNPRYNYLVSAAADGMMKIWDLSTKQMFREVKVCEKELMLVHFSPDGAKVITAGSDGLLKEWEVTSGTMIRSIDAHEGEHIRVAAYSHDGAYIATGSDDRSVKVWQTSDGRLYKEFPKNHKKWVQSMDFASDNKHLVTGGHDGNVIMWSLEKGTEVLSVKQNGMFVSGSVFSPDLRTLITTGYDGKNNVWDISKLNLKPTPKAVEVKNSTVAGRSSSGGTVGRNIFEIVQPRIKMGERFVTLDEELKVRGTVGFEAGVRELTLINSKGDREKIKLSEGGKFEHTVKLGFLENDFTVEAIDTKGTKLEKKLSIYRIFDKNNSSELAKLSRSGSDYALIIATNQYEAMGPLVNPVFDANTIAATLETDYNFQVEKLIDPKLGEITLKIREYAQKLYSDDDQLFIFIAGHGEYDAFYKEGYLVAADSKKGDEGKTSYLPHSALRTYISNIPCKHIFLAMDVCFGGTFDQHIASSRGDQDVAQADKAYFIKRKLNSKTRLYLTSGGKEYVPDGRPGQHSPFARKFLEALSSYGGQDRILTYKELLSFVEAVVPEPRYGDFGDNEPGSDFIFIGR